MSEARNVRALFLLLKFELLSDYKRGKAYIVFTDLLNQISLLLKSILCGAVIEHICI